MLNPVKIHFWFFYDITFGNFLKVILFIGESLHELQFRLTLKSTKIIRQALKG